MEKEQDNRLMAERRSKLDALRVQGNPFINGFEPSHYAADLLTTYGALTNDELVAQNITLKVSGRMMLKRVMGKASFAQIKDKSGLMQWFVSRDNLPEGVYNEGFKKWDVGDIVAATGVLFKTKTDELSVRVSEIQLLTKSLRPLPEKFHGLTDQEIRYRQRYLDLIVNDEVKAVFTKRSEIIAYIRSFFIKHDYLEVETPMMHVIPGGAVAKPFITHHNALNMDLYLRVAPELYLKRLIVGGFDRVFEMNRCFRNEGLSTRHNPEFTSIEFYQAYATYYDLMTLTEKLLRGIATDICGSEHINYQGEVFDLSKPFTQLTLLESLVKYNPQFSVEALSDERVKQCAKTLNIKLEKNWGIGKIQFEIFEHTVEKNLIQPTFITQYPTEVSPLARLNDDNPFLTDRFEMFIGGREIANGFSELNDPEEQSKRFQEQVKSKQSGDEEAMHYDADYINALEYAMPPTAGEGIGIDRLVMFFTNADSIRDVLLFPSMKPE